MVVLVLPFLLEHLQGAQIDSVLANLVDPFDIGVNLLVTRIRTRTELALGLDVLLDLGELLPLLGVNLQGHLQ